MKYPAYHPSKASQIQHDIRISVTGILWAINDLRKNTSLTAQQKAMIEMIHESARRLLTLDRKLPAMLNHKQKQKSLTHMLYK